MTNANLFGTANLFINYPTGRLPEIRNTVITNATPNSITALVELYDNGWRNGYLNFEGNFFVDGSGSIGGNVSGMDYGTSDNYFDIFFEQLNLSVEDILIAFEGSDDASRSIEMGLFAGDDFLDGSSDGGSTYARLMGGNDTAIIRSGASNDVNTNWGSDTIRLTGGGGMIRAGKDSDAITIEGGQWDHMNGNNGADIITNYSSFAGNVYGGKDDDILINADGGGNFFGNLGADTFRPYILNPNGNIISGIMLIKDFEVGVDTLDASNLGTYAIDYQSGSTYISSTQYGIAAILEGVLL